MKSPISTNQRSVPAYEFRGISIKIYTSGGRFSAQFIGPNRNRFRVEKSSETDALEAAKHQIRQLQDPELQQTLQQQKTAEEILTGSGTTLVEAARLIRTYEDKLKTLNATLGEAVDYYMRSHEGTPILVSVVVEEFIALKKQDTGIHHVCSIRSRLKHHFARQFGDRQIGTIKSEEVNRWVASLPVAGRTKSNYYSSLVSLFEFARDQGYLPRGKPTELSLVKRPRSGIPRIEVFSPNDLKGLLNAALKIKSRALPSLVIQALAGVRHEEIRQTDPKKDCLRWNDIWLDQTEPEIHIRPEVAKTGRERFIPLQPALVAWLSKLHVKGSGPVYQPTALSKDYSRICDKAGIRWKKNGLRKSFNTYDAALSGSLQETAKSAGNSSGMIRRYYKKELSQVGKLALEWFSNSPRKFSGLLRKYLASKQQPKKGKTYGKQHHTTNKTTNH